MSGSYDEEAAQRLIDFEEKRIAARLQAHFNNDVWEKRTEPPEDWNKPLPEALAKLAENSLLKEYQENDGVLSLQTKTKSTMTVSYNFMLELIYTDANSTAYQIFMVYSISNHVKQT